MELRTGENLLFVQIFLAQNVSIITMTPAVLPFTVESSKAPEVMPFVPTFPLPPGGQFKIVSIKIIYISAE